MQRSSDLRTKTENELIENLSELRKSLRVKSSEVLNQKEKNIKTPRNIRKDIARVLGVLKEKQILADVQDNKSAQQK